MEEMIDHPFDNDQVRRENPAVGELMVYSSATDDWDLVLRIDHDRFGNTEYRLYKTEDNFWVVIYVNQDGLHYVKNYGSTLTMNDNDFTVEYITEDYPVDVEGFDNTHMMFYDRDSGNRYTVEYTLEN